MYNHDTVTNADSNDNLNISPSEAEKPTFGTRLNSLLVPSNVIEKQK